MIAVKTADVTQDFKSVADRIMRGEKVLISRPKNENIVMITEREFNELDKLRQKNMNEQTAKMKLKEVFEEAQRQSVINGTDNLTMDDINDIIAKERRKERGL